MSDIHDSWQTIDEQPVPVRAASTPAEKTGAPHETTEHTPVPAASRRPAAVIGVVLVLSIGFALVQGLSGIVGQVAQNPNTIVLEEGGVEPSTITLKAGDTITWSNEDSIPHVISFETLLDEDDMPLETEALFPQSSIDTVIPISTTPGTYTYISKTAVHITGEIVIETAGSQTVPRPTATIPAPATTTPTVNAPTVTESVSTNPPADVVTDYAATIPVNPHTVGSPDVPLPPRGSASASTTIRSHTPRTNTETGPAVWIVTITSIAALLFVTRKSFRRV